MENQEQHSQGFSNFRQLLDLWDNYVFTESVHDEIDKFLTHKQVLMTFMYPVDKKKKNSKTDAKLYGATEEGRLAFARLKNPNPDDPEDMQDNFSGLDLQALISHSDESDEVQRIKIFNKDDIKKIKVIPIEKAVDKLSKMKAAKVIKPINTKPPEQILTDDE